MRTKTYIRGIDKIQIFKLLIESAISKNKLRLSKKVKPCYNSIKHLLTIKNQSNEKEHTNFSKSSCNAI